MEQVIFNTDFFVCYIRVTQGCNLDCDHCFTLGMQDPIKFLATEDAKRLVDVIKNKINPKKVIFYIHGGETFLADYNKLEQLFAYIKIKFGDTAIIIPQTNLLVKVDDHFAHLISKYCNNHVGISWDHKIRFNKAHQEYKFFNNVKVLENYGIRYSVAITLHKYLIEETDPLDILEKFKNADTIDFEYLTDFNDKTAILNDIDMELYYKYIERIYDAYLNTDMTVGLPFIDLVYKNIKEGKFTKCKCNCCNERTITMNMDKTIGLCPDMTYIEPISSLDEMENDWDEFQRKSVNLIAKRIHSEFNTTCMKCPSLEICGGNCDMGLVRDDHCFINDVLITRIKDDFDAWDAKIDFNQYIELN